MERRHHINNWVYGIQPDAYESEWVPKKTGLVMHELHCSLGGTFNQTSAGVTPGNYQVWLTDKSAGNITDGFWPSWRVGVNVINAFDKFETIETDEIAWFKRNLSYHTGLNGNGWYPIYLTSPTLKEFKYFDEVNNPNNIAPNIHNFLQAYGGCYPWGDVNSRAVYFPTSVYNTINNTHVGVNLLEITKLD